MPGSYKWNNVFSLFGSTYSIFNIKNEAYIFPQIIKVSLISQLYIFPKQYSNKLFVY